MYKRQDDGRSFFGPERIVIDLESIPDNADYDVYLYQGLGENAGARQAAAISNCQQGPSRSLNERNGNGGLVEGYNSGNEDERISWEERFNATDTGFYIIHVQAVYGSTCTENYTLRHSGLE